MMDIKEEIMEIKMELICDESIDVDEKKDIKLPLLEQNVKLEKQVMDHEAHSINPTLKEESKLTYGLLEEKPSTSTVYFESLVKEGSGDEEFPTGSDKQFEEEVANHAAHSINPTLKEESKLTYELLEEKPSTSTVYFESLVGEGSGDDEESPSGSDKQFEEEVANHAADSINPCLKDDSKFNYDLLEETPSTSTMYSKCLDGEGSYYEDSSFDSDKQIEEEEHTVSPLRKEYFSNTIRSLQKLSAQKDVCSFECRICKKAFPRKYNLNRHIKSHINFRPFQCDICTKSFQQKYHFNAHFLTHTDSHPFQCEVCNKPFRLKAQLKFHMLTHSDIRPFQCDLCNKFFYRKSDLNVHLIIHTDSRPFKCEICNKSFRRKACIKLHMLTHCDRRPYQCHLCNKSFRQKSDLNVHLLTHTDSRPFKCEICNKSFRHKCSLKLHSLGHSDSRAFRCDICGKSFKLKHHLNAHMFIHKDTHPLKCE